MNKHGHEQTVKLKMLAKVVFAVILFDYLQYRFGIQWDTKTTWFTVFAIALIIAHNCLLAGVAITLRKQRNVLAVTLLLVDIAFQGWLFSYWPKEGFSTLYDGQFYFWNIIGNIIFANLFRIWDFIVWAYIGIFISLYRRQIAR